jgi:hypothetical protein
MRPECHFEYSTAIRGKFHRRLVKEDANVVVLEPDVASAFRNSAAGLTGRMKRRPSAHARRETLTPTLSLQGRGRFVDSYLSGGRIPAPHDHCSIAR